MHSAEAAARPSGRFDPEFYRTYYTDVGNLSDDEARLHFLAHGVRLKRFASLAQYIQAERLDHAPLPDDFVASEYLRNNEDLRLQGMGPTEATLHYLRYGRWEGRRYRPSEPFVHSEKDLHPATCNAYRIPAIAVRAGEPERINVLVPAFDFKSMSAGFFGVFQVAQFIARCGYRVRLVMFEKFAFDLDEARERIGQYPGMERLFDDLEVAYLGAEGSVLHISEKDNCVATVWYSAYVARALMEHCGGRPFLYLIQDYETVFHPSGSLYALAEATYGMNHAALFSTEALRKYFVDRGIGNFGRSAPRSISFNNACSRMLPDESAMRARLEGGRIRLVFYARPIVHRNMFELGALALIKAAREGIIDRQRFDVIGIGLGNGVIDLGDGWMSRQLPRMTLKEYQEVIGTFDIGLCLMASSHPSLLPFDLSGSGAWVVTNSFGSKDQAYFDGLTRGVLVVEPDVDAIVEGIRDRVGRLAQYGERLAFAREMAFPTDWGQTFGRAHEAFIRETFAETGRKRRDPGASG